MIQQIIKIRGEDEHIPTSILHQIKLVVDKFDMIEFFHVKRNLNMMVDSLANQGVLLEQGSLKIDDGGSIT